MMDLDLNDPDLLAALGEPGDSSASDENTQKDKRVSEVRVLGLHTLSRSLTVAREDHQSTRFARHLPLGVQTV